MKEEALREGEDTTGLKIFFFFITEEPSMAKSLRLSMGTQTLGC